MKNKNRKKTIIIAIVVVVLCLVGYKIADKVSYPLVRAKAVLYLADKYDAKISDFEMTDHIHSRFIIEDENPYDLKFKLKWKDFAFAEEIISFIANNDKEKNDRLSNFYYQEDSSDNEITVNELSSKLIKKFKFNETPLFTDCDTVEVFIYKQSKYNNFDVYEWTRRMMGSVWRN